MQDYSERRPQRKTKDELESILRERAGNLGSAALEIRPDAIWGWYAVVLQDKTSNFACQARVDQIVNELRNFFELRL